MTDFRNYLGIPYADHGRNRAGLDCWGLVRLIYFERLGITLPSWSTSYDNSDKVNRSEMTVKGCFSKWVSVDSPIIYDVGLFEIGTLMHVGLAVDIRGVNMIHICRGTMVTIEKVKGTMWSKRFKGWWRYVDNCN